MVFKFFSIESRLKRLYYYRELAKKVDAHYSLVVEELERQIVEKKKKSSGFYQNVWTRICPQHGNTGSQVEIENGDNFPTPSAPRKLESQFGTLTGMEQDFHRASTGADDGSGAS